MPLAPRWRLLLSPAADGATNMAMDHALLDRAAVSGEAVLRVYGWSRPTLSLGMHERAQLDPAAVATLGIDVVRRPTGGRALLHHREVTYSVTAPTHAASLAEGYAAINALLHDALRRLGAPVSIAVRRTRATGPDGAACFAEPNAGELVVGARKLVGSAQRRDEHALLQHGSILLADDQPLVHRLRGRSDDPPPAATLSDALQRPVTADEVRDALVEALRHALPHAPEALDPRELDDAVQRHVEHYRDERWTFRR